RAALLLAAIGCSDRIPVAPTTTAAAGPLPAAARYIVNLSAASAASPGLAARIAADGGKILRTHAGFGLLVVAGLSANAATALEHEPGVRLVVPDFQMHL